MQHAECSYIDGGSDLETFSMFPFKVYPIAHISNHYLNNSIVTYTHRNETMNSIHFEHSYDHKFSSFSKAEIFFFAIPIKDFRFAETKLNL